VAPAEVQRQRLLAGMTGREVLVDNREGATPQVD
jgi:hypothetical protein